MFDQDTYLPVSAARPVRPGEAAPSARAAPLGAIIARLEEVIVAETASIRTDMRFDLAASNARKSRHLYELNKAVKAAGPEALAPHRTGLTRLREKLAENERVIRAHLDAVGEVAGLIRSVIERAEADGTYSAGAFARAGS